MKLYLFIFVLIFFKSVSSQNLVPNSSFEEMNSEHYAYYLMQDIDNWASQDLSRIKYWTSPSNLPPFIKGSTKISKTGKIYGDIIAYDASESNALKNSYRTYLQVPLKCVLIAGKEYRFEMFIKCKSSDVYATNSLGAYFSAEQINEKTYGVLNFKPQVEIDPKEFLYSLEWKAITGTFTAKGDEAFLIIGNFNDNKSTSVKRINKKGSLPISRYLLDDISLIPLKHHHECEDSSNFVVETSSSKPEVEIDKVIILKDIYFQTGKYELLANSFTSLNEIVNLLQKDEKLRVNITGYTDNSGSFEENNLLSEQRAKAVANYFITRGIEESKVSYIGLGSSFPIADNSTPEGRVQNRRVECLLLREEK